MVAETKPGTAIVVASSIEQDLQLSTQLAKSALLPEALRKRPEDVLVTVLTGRELGLSPMQSIRGMYVVNGKAVMSADMMVALVLSKRDVCEYFRLVKSTDDLAEYSTKRAGSEPVTMTFTKQQAGAAGLLGKGTWKSYPSAMLRARCASALARAVYPDLVAGVYESDEGEEIRRGGKRETHEPAPAPAKVVELNPPPKAEPKPAPVAPEVVEGVVVAQAVSETGRTLRIIDEPPDQPEPPPPSDEHAPSTAAPVEDGPTLCDDLLAELKSLTEAKALGEWIERCRAGEKRGGLKPEEMLTLKAAYKSHCSSLSKKGGSK